MLRKKEGKPLPDTQEMKIWREEYSQMSVDEHNAKLKALGLSEEEIKEFDANFLKLKKDGKV